MRETKTKNDRKEHDKMIKFDSQKIKNMPWEDCPEGFEGPVWRYSKNPIIDRNPIKGITRIFNSAVVYWKDEYYGIFRAEDISTLPNLRFGKSKDGINWEYEDHTLWIQDEEGNPVYVLDENGERKVIGYSLYPWMDFTQLCLLQAEYERDCIREENTVLQMALCDQYEENLVMADDLANTQIALCDVYEQLINLTDAMEGE